MRIKNEFFQIPVCHRFEADAGRLVVVNPRKWSFYRSADVKTRFMPRLSKKSRANRISSAAKMRTLHSRPPLYRFQEIFHAIKTGRYPNRTKLAETIEVTTKTIQRDIDYMRYQMSVPIEFDYARGGYCFTKPLTELPLFQLTEAELVSVFVMQKDSRTAHTFSKTRPGEGEIQRLFRNSFQIWQSENAELEQIVLRFSGRAAQLVRERNWHSSQQIQELADGNLELGLTLNSLEEIIPWILSWGKDCEVARPAQLRKRIRSLCA